MTSFGRKRVDATWYMRVAQFHFSISILQDDFRESVVSANDDERLSNDFSRGFSLRVSLGICSKCAKRRHQ